MGGFLTFLAHNLWLPCVLGLFVKLISDIIVVHDCYYLRCVVCYLEEFNFQLGAITWAVSSDRLFWC
jgi:hypothetical protein